MGCRKIYFSICKIQTRERLGINYLNTYHKLVLTTTELYLKEKTEIDNRSQDAKRRRKKRKS